MIGLRWQGIEYSVRDDHRARRVILRVSALHGLEVVVPRGFNRRRLPEVLQAHRYWIQQELQRVQDEPDPAAPDWIHLKAIDECWRIEYLDGFVGGNRWNSEGCRNLALSRRSFEIQAVATELNTWLHQKAHAHLVPWLRDVSLETGIPYEKTTVRGQSTRWASCSNLKNISINRKLLFLPPDLVRHVFLHELCHIQRLDHSPAFWQLLQDMDPNSRELEAEVRNANQYVPSWVLPGRNR